MVDQQYSHLVDRADPYFQALDEEIKRVAERIEKEATGNGSTEVGTRWGHDKTDD